MIFFGTLFCNLLEDANLGGFQDLFVDIVCTHEFGGSHLADVNLNCQLRDHGPNWLLENDARKKVEHYRDGESMSPRNGNRVNGNHLEICLCSSQKNRNSLTWVLVALTVCFTYPVLYRVLAES